MATQTKAQVKALQTALNKKGANLVVDGIAGKLTNAAIAKYGSTPTTTTTAKSTSTGTTNGSKTSGLVSGQTVYNTTKKQPIFGNPFSGGFFNNLKGGLKIAKDAINTTGKNSQKATAYDPTNPIYGGGYQIKPDAINITPADQVPTPFEVVKSFGGEIVNKTGAALAPVGNALLNTMSGDFASYNVNDNQPTSSTMPLLENTTGNPDLIGTGNTGTETTKTTETTNPNTGEVTTMSETSPLGSNANVNTNTNVDSANKFNTAMSGLNDSITGMKNNPWDKYSKNGDVVSVADTKINQALGAYTDVASFMNDYNTNPDVKKNVDNYMQVTGKKINDITSKIQPVTNGVVAPQSIDEFLIKNKNANLKAEADGLNKAMILNSDFNTQQEKMAYTANEEFKKTQEAIRDSMERNELRKEASVREKANWMIDKNKAEMEIALADIEQNRLLGKNSLTGLLAKLGALDTTSMSGIALTDLDQKYQAQQQGTRAKYMLANREIEMNMNSDINDLENAMEENIIKINSDLSKSEREVAMDVMKLRYDTQKTALEYKMKYEDALRTEKEKAIAKAESASANYNTQWLQLVNNGVSPELIPGMLDSKGKVKQTAQNASIIQGNYTEPMIRVTADGKIFEIPESQVSNAVADGAKVLKQQPFK